MGHPEQRDGRTRLSDETVAATRHGLSVSGYAVVEDLFDREDAAAVETLIDGLLADLAARGTDDRYARYLGDVAPAGDGDRERHPEIMFAANLRPALLNTRVFDACQALARALHPSVSRAGDHALYKPPHARTGTAWHQDGAFTEHPWARTPNNLHFWIPLQDVAEANGCLSFVPGSHRGAQRHAPFARVRGIEGMAAAVPAPGDAVACPVRAGGVTIHTPLTLHAAGPNLSDRTRKAWIIHFTPLGAARLRLRQVLGRAPGAMA